MINRSTKRSLIAVLLCCLLLTTQSSCGGDLAQQAERVGQVAVQVQPLFQTLIDGNVIPRDAGDEVITHCRFVATNAPLLAKAFRENNTSDVVSLSAALIRVTEQIINEDTLLIPAGPRRTTITAVLVAADIALGIISDNLIKAEKLPQFAHVVAGVQAAQKKDVDTIRKFSRRRRLACRASGPIEKYKAGQYVPMAMCRKYPDQTQVERVEPAPTTSSNDSEEGTVTVQMPSGEFTLMRLADARAQFNLLANKRERSERENRLLASLTIALGTLPVRQNLNDCGDRPLRCETMRGVRHPANATYSKN